MPQSVHSGGSGSSSHHHHHRYVHVVLLNRETVAVPVENKNTRVQDIFSRICDLVDLRETDFFGLAQLKENEFQFLRQDSKISKLTLKIWKSKESSAEEPLQTFYLRVQYYVENISLLREKTTRLQYYLQMKENLLHYGQLVAEEKCFLLASYALQADYGDYVADHHGNSYFDPREYFPASVVMRRGQDYITTHLPSMHRSMAGILPAEARINYIVELSTVPNVHNFHLYKMRKRKYDTAAVAWIAICPTGLAIYEETEGFRYPVTIFLWPDIGKLNFEKKKFEIISEGTAGLKYTHYFDCKEWAEYIVDLCRQVHRFHLKLQPRLAELQLCYAQDPRFSEKYVYSENSEYTFDGHRSLTRIGADGRVQGTVHERPSSGEPAAFGRAKESTLGSKGQEEQEIFITTPPHLFSSNNLSFELPQPLQSFEGYDPEKLQDIGGLPPHGPLVYFGSGNGKGREVEYSIDNIPAVFASYPIPASSSESLAFVPFMKTESFRRDHPQLSSSSAASSNAHSQAPSTLTTPSQRSASPNSSTGSGQLPLSLPISRDVYDAAFLRQSLPHGVHFNDYLQNLWSGEEVTSTASAQRKSSFDHLQLNRFLEPVQRSTSLRQPLIDCGENRKGSKQSQGESGLWVVRSNSDKTPKSSKLTLLPELLGAKSTSRQETRETSAAFAVPSGIATVPSGIATVSRSDSNKSQNLSLYTVSSDQMMSLPGNNLASVARSDSNKSQKSGLSFPPSDAYQHEEGFPVVQRKEDGQFASGLPYPIIPVEAQIQKLVFGPTMTAVSTPVRPASEKPAGNLPALSSYQSSPYTYIPEPFPASVIRHSLRSSGAAGIFSVPHQNVAVSIPSDILYQNSRPNYTGHLETKTLLPLSSNYLSDQAPLAVPQLTADESVEGNYHDRPSPPPYGAIHSTISSVQFQNPGHVVEAHQMTPTQLSQVTVVKPYPTDALAKPLQQKPNTGLDPVISSAAGKREFSSWVMMNGGQQTQTGSVQGQAQGISQDAQRRNSQGQSTAGNHHQLEKSAEGIRGNAHGHLEQSNRDKKSEVIRHVSDRHPGHHDPHCPRHGISSDIRERLRSLGPSVPPMLNALLMDKSLHSTSCTCHDGHSGDRRISAAHSSDSLNLSGLSTQPKGRSAGQHRLRYFADLSLEGGDATMIINGTMTLNGTNELEGAEDLSDRLPSTSQKARPEIGRRLVHHLSDSEQRPQRVGQLGHNQSSSDSEQRPQRVGQLSHNQSSSDSAAQNFVSSEC